MVEHNSLDISLNINYSSKPEGVRKVSVLVETLSFSLPANITFFWTRFDGPKHIAVGKTSIICRLLQYRFHTLRNRQLLHDITFCAMNVIERVRNSISNHIHVSDIYSWILNSCICVPYGTSQTTEKDMGWRVGFATYIEDLSQTLFTNAVYNVVYANNHVILMPWWHEILIFVLH